MNQIRYSQDSISIHTERSSGHTVERLIEILKLTVPVNYIDVDEKFCIYSKIILPGTTIGSGVTKADLTCPGSVSFPQLFHEKLETFTL